MNDLLIIFSVIIILLSQIEYLSVAAIKTPGKRMSCPSLSIPNARIRYKTRSQIARIRCKSGFLRIGGDRRLTCIRGLWTGRVPTCIAPGCDDPLIKNGGVLPLLNGALLQVYCNHGYILEGSSFLFCNGSSLNDTAVPSCQVPPPNEDHLDCSYENQDLCGWKQDHTDTHNWDWTRADKASFTGALGTAVDHTFGTGKGHYIMVDSSLDWNSKDTARLFSPILKLPDETLTCVVFWYHMFGPTPGPQLNVYVRPESEPFEVILPAVTLTNSDLKDWRMAYVTLDEDEDRFQIVFEVKGTDGHFNDVCIDDFLVTSGNQCFKMDAEYIESNLKGENNKTTTTTTVTNPTTKQTETPPALGSCKGRCHHRRNSQHHCDCYFAEPGDGYIPCKDLEDVCTKLTTSTAIARDTTTTLSPSDSCKGRCYTSYNSEFSCQCYLSCGPQDYTCCPDFSQVCHSTTTENPPPEGLSSNSNSSKNSSWIVPLVIIAALVVSGGALFVWWRTSKKGNHDNSEFSDTRNLSEEAKREDIPEFEDVGSQRSTKSYSQLSNSDEFDEGTPV